MVFQLGGAGTPGPPPPPTLATPMLLLYVVYNWEHKIKNGDFRFENLLIGLKIYNSKTAWLALLKFVHKVGAYKWFRQTKFRGARSRDQNVAGQKWAESGRF